MSELSKNMVRFVIENNKEKIFQQWLDAKLQAISQKKDLLNDVNIQQESRELFELFHEGFQAEHYDNFSNPAWNSLKNSLDKIIDARVKKGFTPVELGTIITAIKNPFIQALGENLKDTNQLIQEIWKLNKIVDIIALHTVDTFIKKREEIIKRQQEEMLELSSPALKIFDGIIVVPLIGTLDSARAQIVMETLLHKIVDTGSSVAIIDITGVPSVDTLVAQNLIKTISASRLLGAESIISGVRPQIAQTMVHLGVTLSEITTKATLEEALKYALTRVGYSIKLEQ